MSTFMNTDPKAFSGVWVFCEQRQGKMMPTTFELISEGRKLADELGVQLSGILLGDSVDNIAAELGGYGADKVYVYNSPLLKDYTTDAYTKIITDAVHEFKPEIMLFGASHIGRDLAPRCAARLHTGLCADCTHLDVDLNGYINFLRTGSSLDVDAMNFETKLFDVNTNLKMTRPAFGGHLMATIVCPLPPRHGHRAPRRDEEARLRRRRREQGGAHPPRLYPHRGRHPHQGAGDRQGRPRHGGSHRR